MDHVYWTSSLNPGVGWTVTRYRRKGTLFAEAEMIYTGLMARERDQVLDEESTAALLGYF